MSLLTAAQIAKELNLPESTVRYYRDRFAEYIPTTGEGRSRRYRPEALEVFRFISDRLRTGMPADVLETELRPRFQVEIEVDPQTAGPQPDSSSNATAMVPVPAFLEIMVQVGAALESVSELPEVVNRQSQEITGLRQQVKELTAAVTAAAAQQQASEARDRELVAAVVELRKVAEEERSRPPLWRRVLGLSTA